MKVWNQMGLLVFVAKVAMVAIMRRLDFEYRRGDDNVLQPLERDKKQSELIYLKPLFIKREWIRQESLHTCPGTLHRNGVARPYSSSVHLIRGTLTRSKMAG